MYSTYSSLFCFAETNINDSPAKHIDEILDDWKDIHKNIQHSLALCYNVSKVNITEVIETPSVLGVLPIVPGIEKETILLVIKLPTQHRMLIVGDFNPNQMLYEHVDKVDPLI